MDSRFTGRRGILGSTLTLFAVVSGIALAQPPAGTPAESNGRDNVKPPWDWTLEERLNERFDPHKIRQRMTNRGHNPQVDLDTVPENYEILSGQEHPHLFMPSRVFDEMLSLAFGNDPDYRTPHRKQMAERYDGELKIDDAFWRDLSIITATYLAAERDYQRLRHEYRAAVEAGQEQESQRLKAEARAANLSHCQQRYQALESTREHFGWAEFDRFLYQAVTVNLWEAGEWTPRLRRARANIARGCPDDF